MTTSPVSDLLTIDPDAPTPPFEQVRLQVTALVESGRLLPGDRVPPVRQLAADLGLAAGTVARAYKELEGSGVVETRRGAGTRVAARPESASVAELDAAAAAYLDRAAELGASPEQAGLALDRAARRR